MPLILVHADPRRDDAMDAVEQLARDSGGFLVGGLTVGEGVPHRADLGGANLSSAAFPRRWWKWPPVSTRAT